MFGLSAGFHIALILIQLVAVVPFVNAGFFHWRSRTLASGSCDRKITRETRLRLTGDTQPSVFKFPPYCALKILSEANTKIKLTFQNPVGYQCSQTSFVSVLDGWLIADGMRRSQSFVPQSEDISRKRQKLICMEKGRAEPETVESSRNLAEIAYKLQPGHEIDVLIQFIPKNQSCDVVLSDEDAGKEFLMDTKAETGVCRWYLPGGAMINVHEFSLVTRQQGNSEEEQCAGSRLLVKSGDSYSNLKTYKTVCTPGDIARPIPTYCKLTVLELQSIDPETRQFVKFSFEFTPYKLRVLALC